MNCPIITYRKKFNSKIVYIFLHFTLFKCVQEKSFFERLSSLNHVTSLLFGISRKFHQILRANFFMQMMPNLAAFYDLHQASIEKNICRISVEFCFRCLIDSINVLTLFVNFQSEESLKRDFFCNESPKCR